MQVEGKQDGLVSIIMPSYNSEKYIVTAIKSVQAQTYENWELLVVDDCSTDSTVDIIRRFEDARIRPICQEKKQWCRTVEK